MLFPSVLCWFAHAHTSLEAHLPLHSHNMELCFIRLNALRDFWDDEEISVHRSTPISLQVCELHYIPSI